MIQNQNSTHGRDEISQSPGRKPTLLFVDHSVPQYDLYAGSRTNFMYLSLLVEMGLEVKFLPADFHRIEPYSSELNRMGIETLDGDWYRQNWKSWLRANGPGFDFVFFHKPDPAAVFLPEILSCSSAAIIYQCHDLHYLRLQRKARIENDPAILEQAKGYEEKENYIFSICDVVLTFSEVEEKLIKEKFPRKTVCTVPLFFYENARANGQEFSDRSDLLYVGASAHTPNRDAISWFAKEIFPLIRQTIPEIVFNVVSADPPEDIASLDSESIRILGRVSDDELEELYANSRIMVVPLRFGAGIKGKVIEAFRHGLPIVSTAIGLEGLKDIDQLISPHDTPEEFSSEVISVYNNDDKLKELSRSGSKFVESNYTRQKTEELMSDILTLSRGEAAIRISSASPNDTRQFPTRLIAFYLPQFHPIPENDEWWGEGFTEWRNVSAAKPIFPGHHQPHVPAELGYYDLRQGETRIAQAELARQYGIEGFCYYHYWFNGRRLLEHPLNELMNSGEPDFPFCICWANENWTRRWDGRDKEILMQQKYSEEDDRNHIRSLFPIFQDKRYIRINGKPLFLVYRTGDLPDPARTAEIWRDEARLAGIGELHLCRVESMDKSDPRLMGFDAAVEFAPDWWNKGPELGTDSKLLEHAGPGIEKICETNYVHSYEDLADTMMSKSIPDYQRYRCVTPTWDNWARMTKGANVFLGSTPEKYRNWLSRTITATNARLMGEERLVFINAWNEWAEGSHLEPDQKFGHGYLEATSQALEESKRSSDSGRAGVLDSVRMGHLMNQVASQKSHLKRARQRVAQQDLKIQEMLNSTSWRVTAPLRWVMQKILNIKDMFSG